MSKGRAEAAAGAPGILLRYLQEQNRPYSAQDMFGNLQREHGLGKAAVVKALEQLAQQGKIKEKVYGKQKIYFADQDQFAMVSDADLRGLDAKIVALTAKVQSLQQGCRHMEAGRTGQPLKGPLGSGSARGQELQSGWFCVSEFLLGCHRHHVKRENSSWLFFFLDFIYLSNVETGV
ncbi:homologous-pairing protein 2 homolog [Leptonychotes weddellii]|uniref:Homologous-pairing protein 2 homolog n=1 Tax=Leptonychotes weddellii TaxID=9713 RepID=A0A7F8R8Z3_LEPWE|nr:homologous-pairing protein 2 homolog [Leptonychotes weddellii]